VVAFVVATEEAVVAIEGDTEVVEVAFLSSVTII
jgi:hypothetical protein